MESTMDIGICASCGKGHRDVSIEMLDKKDHASTLIAGYSAVKIGTFTCKTTDAPVGIYQVLE